MKTMWTVCLAFVAIAVVFIASRLFAVDNDSDSYNQYNNPHRSYVLGAP